MIDRDGLKLWKVVMPFISKFIKNETDDCVRRRPAIVIDADNLIHYATVRFPSSPDRNDQNMLLMNCSGKPLKTGDSVWIDYMYGLTNAYISIKNDGKPWGW